MKFNSKFILNIVVGIFILFDLSSCYATNYNTKKIDWILVNFDHSLNNNYDNYLGDKDLQNISLKSIDSDLFIDDIFINNKKLEFKEKFINDNFIKYLVNNIEDINLNKIVYYNFNLSNNPYQISQPVVLQNQEPYIFLYTENKIFLTFRPKYFLQKSFSTMYQNLSVTKLPISKEFFYSYENILTSIPDYFKFYLGRNYDEEQLKAAKLNNENLNYKLILLSSVSMAGYPTVMLITLNNEFEIIDKIIFSEQYEVEYGFVNIITSMDSVDQIEQKEIEYIDNKQPKILSIKKYFLDNYGYFIKKID